jgi:predicted DNA-binding protein
MAASKRDRSIRTIRLTSKRDFRLVELSNQTGKTQNFLINRAIEFSLNSPEFIRHLAALKLAEEGLRNVVD